MKIRRVIASHGLGNQLFQFCFAHYLKESGYKVRFENYPIWSPGLSYSLKKLKTICPHVDFSINPTISHTSILGRMSYRLKIAIPLSDIYMRYARYTRFIESPNQYFTARDLSTLPNVKKSIYQGFWIHWTHAYSQQNSAIADIQKYLSENVDVGDYLVNTNKNLVIHVRRGDYLDRGNESSFGVITAQSYKELISKIKKQYIGINVVTLTNDFNLSENELYGEDFGHILPPDLCDPWQALKLMSQADIVISANSTLSWWGAVIASLNGGIAYIPKNFYKNFDTKDAFHFPTLLRYNNSHY